MKHCPSCRSQYSDITLSFCLQDGTPLAVGEAKQSTIDTVAFSHPVTAQNILPTRDFRVDRPLRNETRQHFPVNRAPMARQKKSRKGLIAMAIVLPVVMLAMAGGGAAWVYFAKQKQVSAKQETVAVVTAEKDKVESPPAQPAVTETLKSQNAEVPAAKVDSEAIKKEIADVVESWKDFTEGHNAEKLAAMYGDKVDYLGKPGKSAGEIRSEMQKTFDAFSEIDISISNLMVAVDSEGTSATALFDKEWSYEANPKLTEGKAHTKLHFQKTGGDWKIVTERYLKIYYNEN